MDVNFVLVSIRRTQDELDIKNQILRTLTRHHCKMGVGIENG